MGSLEAPILHIPATGHPDGLTPLDARRVAELGHGERVDRSRLVQVCRTASAANQWLDKASKEGLLVPVAWGEYEVVDADVLDVMRLAQVQAHRRFISWSQTLPRTLHPDVAFLAPRVWLETGLRWTQAAPIVPFDGTDERAPAPLGVLGYSLSDAQTWRCRVGAEVEFPVRVPSRTDATILLGSNLDDRWQRAAVRLADGLGPSQRIHARRQLARLHRFSQSHSTVVRPAGAALRTPRWWNEVHDRAVERLVRNAYEI